MLLYLISFPAHLLFKYRMAFMYGCTNVLLKIIFFVCCIRININGLSNIANGQRRLLIANHPGMIDPLYLIAVLPFRIRIVVQPSLFRAPLLGRVMKSIGCIAAPDRPVEYLHFGKEVKSALEQSDPVLIFPERPRKRGEILADFNFGPMRIAGSLEADLIPMVLRGSEIVLPKGRLLLSPATIRVYADLPTKKDATIEQLEARFRQIFKKL